MIRHIVMWKLKPEAEGRTAAENAEWMKEHSEDLSAYKVHPAHKEISAYSKKVRESRVACDFEI
ncbi:MAG: Dabb family protein [Bacteroidales bacterium]|nr:Dabb family protein [Bacteroidales bacterium]